LLMSQNDSILRNFFLCKKCWQKWPHSRKFCRTLHLARLYCLYSPELPPHSTSRTKGGKQILAWLNWAWRKVTWWLP
jgi:predicted amidophosphoribosyltransferase